MPVTGSSRMTDLPGRPVPRASIAPISAAASSNGRTSPRSSFVRRPRAVSSRLLNAAWTAASEPNWWKSASRKLPRGSSPPGTLATCRTSGGASSSTSLANTLRAPAPLGPRNTSRTVPPRRTASTIVRDASSTGFSRPARRRCPRPARQSARNAWLRSMASPRKPAEPVFTVRAKRNASRAMAWHAGSSTSSPKRARLASSCARSKAAPINVLPCSSTSPTATPSATRSPAMLWSRASARRRVSRPHAKATCVSCISNSTTNVEPTRRTTRPPAFTARRVRSSVHASCAPGSSCSSSTGIARCQRTTHSMRQLIRAGAP